jgi:hypothetical protein
MQSSIIFFLAVITHIGFAQRDAPNWRNLFNGKNLSGWKVLNGKATFTVQQGMIVGRTVAGEPNSFLTTEETFGDFILELEFKIDEGTNSGIQFRSESKPDYQNGRVHGYQYEIDPSARAWTGGIYDEARREWLYPLEYNPISKGVFKANDWNTARIECIGSSLRTFVNGIPAAHVADDMTSRGFIALQVHAIYQPAEAGKQVYFRNIRIQTKDLRPTPWDNIFVANFIPNSISPQEQHNHVELLWDGRTTTGWRGAYKKIFRSGAGK